MTAESRLSRVARIRSRFALAEQRGGSRLGCPEFDRANVLTFYSEPFVGNSAVTDYTRATRACRNRLTAAGIDLAAYISAESAADLEALRRALGYRQWNLFALSADGVLGLTYMRLFPGGIRSAVVDSGQSPSISGVWTTTAASTSCWSGLVEVGPLLIAWSCSKDAVDQLTTDSDAACVDDSLATQPLQLGIETRVIGVREALAACVEANASAPALTARRPADAVVSAHAISSASCGRSPPSFRAIG